MKAPSAVSGLLETNMLTGVYQLSSSSKLQRSSCVRLDTVDKLRIILCFYRCQSFGS